MTDNTKPIIPLRQRMIEDMTLRKLTPKTQSTYLGAVIRFTRFLGRAPDTATPEDLRRYQLHLVDTGIGPSAKPAPPGAGSRLAKPNSYLSVVFTFPGPVSELAWYSKSVRYSPLIQNAAEST